VPSVPPIANDYLKSLLNGLQAQITALVTTQNQYVLDNNSIVRVQVGWHQTNNSYGVTIFDPSGNRRVVLGQLPNGDHGIELIDLSGNTQELLPSRDDYGGPTLSTTSVTPVACPGHRSSTSTSGRLAIARLRRAPSSGVPLTKRPMRTSSLTAARQKASSA
jgi:hypothetical protein